MKSENKTSFETRLYTNKRIAERMPDKEDERQIYRKKKIVTSRFLDNYYNPKVENLKAWKPNGAFVTKKLHSNKTLHLQGDWFVPPLRAKQRLGENGY